MHTRSQWLKLVCFVCLCGTLGGCEVPELDPVEESVEQTQITPSQDSSPKQGNDTIATAETKSQPAGGPIGARRGLAMVDWPDGFVYVLVKADVETTTAAIATEKKYRVVKNALGESLDHEKLQTIVCQFQGHPWSLFAWFQKEPGKYVSELSRALDTEAIMIAFSDFTGWQFVEVYQSGENVESMHWGLDYSEETGRGPDLSKWDTHATVTTNHEGIDFVDQFLFRSKLRKISEEELRKGDEFADWLLREHDAYVSDSDLPWIGENGSVSSPLGKPNFSGVQAVLRQ